MLDLLAFSPHPDDVELCCGGLLAKLCRKRYHVGIVDLSQGEMGTEGSGETRTREASNAAKILGVEVRENMNYGDCKINPSFSDAKRLAEVIRRYRPSILLAPYGDSHHPDHEASRRLTEKAAFLAKLVKIKTANTEHRVKKVLYYMLHEPFNPTFIVDVSAYYGMKLHAINAYMSQKRLIQEKNGLLKRVEIRDRFYGSKIGVEYGEPFYCRTPLKIDDPLVFSE